MIFRGWQKTSLIEYPGKVVSVLWVGGCNFRCPWCYNKDLVSNPEKLPSITEDEILDFLKTRIGLLDGIIITGGEPTLKGGLYDFVKKVKTTGFLIGLETNGSRPELLKKLIKEKLIDFVAMDIKAPLDENKYKEVCGVKVDLNKIKKSIKIIKDSGVDYEFRTTVIPDLTKNDIIKIAKYLSGVKKYALQQFVPKDTILKEEYRKLKPHPDEELKMMQKEAKKFIKNIILRT